MRCYTTLLAFASLVLAIASSDVHAAAKVLICHPNSTGATGATDLKTKLTATGLFTVDLFDCTAATPTLVQLRAYDSVLVYSSPTLKDTTTLGNVLADYFDAGGGVVTAQYAMYNGSTGYSPGGRWQTGNYFCLTPASTASGTTGLKPAANDPNSPLVQGVKGISSGYRGLSALNGARNATSVWDWTDGRPAICQMAINGRPRIDLNWYPVPTYYTESQVGDHTTLFKNALLVAGGGTGFSATPSTVSFPDTGTGSTAQGVSVSFTNTSSSSQTVSGFAIGGTHAADFGYTGAPTTPATIAVGASFTVSVTFSPKQEGARAGIFSVSVSGKQFTLDVPLGGKGLGPKLVATPAPLKLGTSTVGTPVMKDVTVANQGGGKLNVTAASISLDPQEFSIVSSPNYPIALPAGGQFTVTVRFNPTVTGLRTGELTILSDDPNSPTVKVALVGTSGPPAIALSSASLAFAAVNVGATSAYEQVTITNNGFSDLDISGIVLGGAQAGDYKLDRTTAPTKLPPGASGSFGVAFAPTDAGSRTATVTVSSNDPAAPTKSISLLGTATRATLDVTPTTLDFGVVKVGASSATQSVTISNAGTGALSVIGFAFNGNAKASYELKGGSMPRFTVNAGASATVSLACVPKMNGTLDATFDITGDVGVKKVVLKCQGSAPMIATDPATVDFGSSQIGQASVPSTVKISNTGKIDLGVSRITVAGTDAAQFATRNPPGTPFTIAPGASRDVMLVFTPTTAGAKSGSLQITSDDPQVPIATVALTGTGVQLGLSITPAGTLDFGLLEVGAIANPKTLTLRNTGNTKLTINKVVLGGPGAGRFSVDETGPFDIAVGRTAALEIGYAPQVGGVDQATLTIEPVGLSTMSVALKGTGVLPTLTLTPPALEFGPIFVDHASVTQQVTIKNGGKSPVTFTVEASKPGDFNVDTSATETTLEPGATTTFDVAFTPTGVGPIDGDVGLKLEGVVAPVARVSVTGSGIDPPTKTGGCSVAAGGRGSAAPALLALAALLTLALVARRRSRREG